MTNTNLSVEVIGTINEDYTVLRRYINYQTWDYIIAYNYDPITKTWGQGHYYMDMFALARGITTYTEDYMSYSRLEEIATQALNYLPWEDLESVFDDLDMTQEEAEYFGLDEEHESYRKDSYKYND